jgi:hypothetical protein
MGPDRATWLVTSFTKEKAPAWPCPSCEGGTLALDAKTVHAEETPESKAARGHEEWDPTWESYRFTAVFRCTRPECRDIVVACGDSETVEDYDPQYGQSFEAAHRPRCFVPALPVVRPAAQWPEKVREHLVAAFGVFWQDPDACANRIRAAVEAALDSEGIKRNGRHAKGGRRRLSLHDRIQLFAKTKPELGDMLMAVKWIGNYGSHEVGVITRSDVLDGLELFEHVLGELFERRSTRLKSMARRIARKKGPLSRKKAR